ncbi:hypothetical protein HYU20_01425, partial [Candidatus Woesearchaeota archaeon]|nr:hypothetical protein [Candidatus Woesearchaeota archaeon]
MANLLEELANAKTSERGTIEGIVRRYGAEVVSIQTEPLTVVTTVNPEGLFVNLFDRLSEEKRVSRGFPFGPVEFAVEFAEGQCPGYALVFNPRDKTLTFRPGFAANPSLFDYVEEEFFGLKSSAYTAGAIKSGEAAREVMKEPASPTGTTAATPQQSAASLESRLELTLKLLRGIVLKELESYNKLNSWHELGIKMNFGMEGGYERFETELLDGMHAELIGGGTLISGFYYHLLRSARAELPEIFRE